VVLRSENRKSMGQGGTGGKKQEVVGGKKRATFESGTEKGGQGRPGVKGYPKNTRGGR